MVVKKRGGETPVALPSGLQRVSDRGAARDGVCGTGPAATVGLVTRSQSQSQSLRTLSSAPTTSSRLCRQRPVL